MDFRSNIDFSYYFMFQKQDFYAIIKILNNSKYNKYFYSTFFNLNTLRTDYKNYIFYKFIIIFHQIRQLLNVVLNHRLTINFLFRFLFHRFLNLSNQSECKK